METSFKSAATFAARWLFAGILSLGVIWGVTAFFTENLYPRNWSPELERNVPVTGSYFQKRTEGWATTRFGEFGLPGISGPLPREVPKVLIWGDSFVQGFHVPDEDKLANRLTGLIEGDPELKRIQGLATAQNGWSVADFVFHIPHYEEALGNPALHVIHLHTLEDIYPDRNPEHRLSLFLSEPELHFERYDNEFRELEEPVRESSSEKMLMAARAQFFARTGGRLLSSLRGQGLRFHLGRQRRGSHGEEEGIAGWSDLLDPDWVDSEPPREAWRFALDRLYESAEAPVLVVYVPVTPTLFRGQVSTRNPEEKLIPSFSEVCDRSGVHFVSAERSFLEYWKSSGGEFPHGFSNSRPWEGHYNREGHRLVAEVIYEWVKENSHVVYPD